MMLKRYLLVAKPGIFFGNLIAVAGGFFLAARGTVEPVLLLATVIGQTQVVASGC
ncbi:protoheme IX farnesyltransferase, partial [Pseudomonas aeruginosa]